MPYPRFTKVIIDYFISKDNTISMRNMINLHTVRDDILLGTLKFVSKTKDCQIYGAMIPDGMINDDIKLSKAYKTYLDYSIRKVPPKKARKFKKPTSSKLKTVYVSPKEPTQKGKRVKRPAKKATTVPITGVVIRDTPDKSVLKNKAPAKIGRGKGIKLLSDTALLEEAQMKKALKKNESDDVNDEDDNDDDNGDDDYSDDNDDGGDDDRGNKDDYEENPSFTLKDYEEEEQDEEYMYTPKKDKFDDEEKMYEEEDNDVAKELYGDLNITQGLRDTNMTNAEQGTMKSSSVSSDFTSKLLNLDNAGSDVNEIASLMNTLTVPPSPPPVNPSSHLTTTPQQQTPESTTTTTNPITTLL
ncbi:hypothetical protein Tco_0138828 [Tanacetum coccineum]